MVRSLCGLLRYEGSAFCQTSIEEWSGKQAGIEGSDQGRQNRRLGRVIPDYRRRECESEGAAREVGFRSTHAACAVARRRPRARRRVALQLINRLVPGALSAGSSAIKLITMSRHHFAIRVTSGLGLLSLLALGASHLALTDIAHGEPDLRLEWNVLRISGAVIAIFIVAAIAALRRTAKHRR